MKLVLSYLFLLLIFARCTMVDGLFDKPDRIWIEVASGEQQCMPPNYTSLDDAINQLKQNNIDVFDKEAISTPVCAACNCPTGLYYRAYINKSDLEDAERLGWR